MILTVSFRGLRSLPFKNLFFIIILCLSFPFLYYFVALDLHVSLLRLIFSNYIPDGLFLWLESVSFHLSYFFVYTLFGILVTFCFGIKQYNLIKKYQDALLHLSIKQPNGKTPEVKKVEHLNEYVTRVTIFSGGTSTEDFVRKSDNIKGHLGSVVESVKYQRDPRFIDLTLTTKILPNLFKYHEIKPYLTKPYQFSVGMSMAPSPICCELVNPPHCLIAGSTGSGKSVFFNQFLISLLTTSERLQLKLVDLKGGVEFKPYSKIPFVSVYQNELEAMKVLQEAKLEMDRRYMILNRKNRKEISPERDKLDRIVIAIDEASVLYTIPRGLKDKKDTILKCRDYTDEIAKKGRSAGIHLVMATQKVDSSAIDPKTLENIDLRMAFKANSYAGSTGILGNKMAYELSGVRGRGIWRNGNKFTEVQTPLLSEEELNEELINIQKKFEIIQKKRVRDGEIEKAETEVEQHQEEEIEVNFT